MDKKIKMYRNSNSIEKEERITSLKTDWFRSIAIKAVFIAVICVFSTKAIAQQNVTITHGKGVSKELLTEYQAIVNKYLERYSIGNPGEKDKFYWKSDYLSEEDWTRLYVIYFQMTYDQQKEQMISFRGPPSFDSIPSSYRMYFQPPQRFYDMWIENKKIRIRIDSEQVDNSTLNSYKPSDFFVYNTSSLLRSGGQKDEYRIDLWTETGYKKFREQFFEQPVSIDQLLEIEPTIVFLVEKDNNKPITLQFMVGPRNDWVLSKVTSDSTSVSSSSPSTPSTYHPKTVAELYIKNPNPLNKWKIGKKTVNSATFELQKGQSAVYDGEINGRNFKNFGFKARVSHSENAKASFQIHSDANLKKGYSILIGKPADDRRRSGSLASVRNLYKPKPSSFDLEVVVQGKRIVVMIDGKKVVDYLEPAVPYRTAANAAQILSGGGLIGFRVENGTLIIANADITILADNLPNYPEGKAPIDEQDDTLIRLQQRNFPVVDYHVHWPPGLGLEAAVERSLADGFEFGIASHAISDEQVKSLFSNDFIYPQLFYAMQGEGREWPAIFSKKSHEMFDYVFTDALTFNDHKGRLTLLWIDRYVNMDIPEQEYMDMIMDRTLKIINEEPIDFFASPTRLSETMMKDYDKYWTEPRIAQLIKALKDNDVALEINSISKVPSAKIIKAAKAAGVKFTLGTNNERVQELDRLAYPLRMVEECGLTIDDMWFPKGQ